MRYVRIFLLNIQKVFEQRGRSFVWFLTSLFSPVILILYWRGVLQNNNIAGWDFSSIYSYYLLLAIASAFLMSHVEEDVSDYDIRKGDLVRYLTRPFSYFWMKLFEEIPYRLLQGSYGIIISLILFFIFGKLFSFSNDLVVLVNSGIIIILAYFLAFSYKMILGLTAFWLTDSKGLFNTVEIVMLILAGFILPLNLMPSTLSTASQIMPFSYMIYYPVTSLLGRLSADVTMRVILMQILWLVIFFLIYQVLWRNGIRKFTGMGQ